MIKVYFWKMKGTNIGHSAMDIAFGEGPGRADYVSWWPGDAGAGAGLPKMVWSLTVGGLSAYVSTFAGDVESENSQPDGAVEIRGLDENRMLAAWNEMKKPGGKYVFLGENCAQTVVTILNEGGAKLSYACRLFSSNIRVWAPWDVFTYARLINGEIETIKKQISAGFVREEPGLIDKFLMGVSAPPGGM